MAVRATAPRAAARAGLQIVSRPINELTRNPGNPRSHPPAQITQIARSIKAFGFNVPVLIDGDGVVVAGHGRLLAAAQLGMCEVPTISLMHLTAKQAQAFMIADNQLTLNSAWDDELLAKSMKELAAADLDFTLDVMGFELPEIDMIIEGPDDRVDEEPDEDDELPEPVTGPTVSQAGDLWRLGPHSLYQGSALDAVSYAALMGTTKAAMVFTDPPYNVAIDGHVGGKGAIKHKEFAMASGEMTPAQFVTFLSTAIRAAAAHSMDGAIHYLCMDWRHVEELQAAAKPIYSELKNICVWTKSTAGMGSFYRSQHELVFAYKYGKAKHKNHIQLGRFGRNRSNVWSYASPSSFGHTGEEGKLLALHPTVKPVALVADAILDASARGDVVLDPFVGSGTTLIAAERVGRICHAIELDPAYVDTVIRRWQLHAGDKAILAATGKTFDAMKSTRERRHGRS